MNVILARLGNGAGRRSEVCTKAQLSTFNVTLRCHPTLDAPRAIDAMRPRIAVVVGRRHTDTMRRRLRKTHDFSCLPADTESEGPTP